MIAMTAKSSGATSVLKRSRVMRVCGHVDMSRSDFCRLAILWIACVAGVLSFSLLTRVFAQGLLP